MTEGSAPDARSIQAQAALFGYDPTYVRLTVRPRPRRWRVLGAVRIGVVAVLLAPLVALLPPHAPWALGAVGVGALLVRRRLQERFTVEAVDGGCPRCGEALAVTGGRLRMPHPASCTGCHNELTLQLDAAEMELSTD